VNRHLEELLREVGIESAGEDGFWRRTLMLRATGPFPDTSDGPEALTWHGFHLVVLDRDGRPADRIKCRSPFDSGFERECRLMESLGRDPRLSGVVPGTRTAHSERIRLHRTPHIMGTTFEPVRSERDSGRWAIQAGAILGIVHRVTEVAEERFPELRRDDGLVQLEAETDAALETLTARGLSREACSRFKRHLAGAVVPRRLQFGDLWPGNVLRGPEGWTLIDFERFGVIQFPLYDVFHLIWSSGPAWRLEGLQPLLSLMGHCGLDSLPMETGSLLLEMCRAEGVSRGTSIPALTAFALEVSGYRSRPGMPESAWRPFLRDLEWLAQWLERS